MRRRAGLRAAAIATALAAPAGAQETGGGFSLGQAARERPGILVIDRDAVLRRSALGRARLAAISRDEEALAAENREIEARLTAEEADLARRRPDMETAAFREEAEAFDRRVTQVRRTQDAKTRALRERQAALADGFWQEVVPVLGAMMAERGAGVVLDRGEVFLTAAEVDVTAELIARLDAAAAAGGGAAAD